MHRARESGKEIIAYTSGLGTTGYLLASQANEVILERDSYGSVRPFGFSRIRQYQKDFYKNIKINVNVYAAGDFKSGPEGYTRNDMSETDKLAWLEFVTPIWEKYKSLMETGRGFEAGKIQYIGDNYHLLVSENGGNDNEAALAIGLVDKLMTKQEIRNYLIEKYGNDEEDEEGEEEEEEEEEEKEEEDEAEEKEKEYERPEGISGREYLSTLKAEDIDTKKRKAQLKNKIAVIHVEGAIVTGNIGFNTAGSDGIVKNINKARDDKT